MAYSFWDAKELIESSVAPDSITEAAAYRNRVIAMFRDAEIDIAWTPLTESQLAEDPGRWIIAIGDECASMTLYLEAIPGPIAERFSEDLVRARYFASHDLPERDAWFASLRIANALGYKIQPEFHLGEPGCPTLAELAQDTNAFSVASCGQAEVGADGVVNGGLLDGRILGVTKLMLYP